MKHNNGKQPKMIKIENFDEIMDILNKNLKDEEKMKKERKERNERVKKMEEFEKKWNYEDYQKEYHPKKVGEPGYPKQANINVSYPDIEDIDDPFGLFDADADDAVNGYKLDNEESAILDALQQMFTNESMSKKNKRKYKTTKPHEENTLFPTFEDNKGNKKYITGIRIFKRQGEEDDSEKNQRSENFEVIKNSKFNFSHVGGYAGVKRSLNQTLHMLNNYEKYVKFNVDIPKGLLLYGPPGNGKTLIAKGFAGESKNASFIAVSGSQFVQMYVGVGAARIRELFELAKKNKPCIIFIDEIDAIARSRSGANDKQSNTESQSALNELLVQMDGFNTEDGIFVIGATNRVDILDDALREGRFDKKIYVGKPDKETRKAILDIHKQGKPVDETINDDSLLEMCKSLSGAQIKTLLNEGMLRALRHDKEVMNVTDLETVLSRMLVGHQITENIFSEDLLKRIAVHEMGHALVAMSMGDVHPKVVKVCLNTWSPTSPGYTVLDNEEFDTALHTKEGLHARIMTLLGGRIAEEVVYGASITTGASEDIKKAYELVENMIVRLGMGSRVVMPIYSENSKISIDRDISRAIDNAYNEAREIVKKAQPIIEICANELLKRKVLLVEDIEGILSDNDFIIKK
jgi:cell division protease FtsH